MGERKYQAGFYMARGVEGSEQQGYSDSGGEQISLALDVALSDQQTARLTTILSFAGGAMAVSIDRLKALGWDGSNELRGINRNEVEVEIRYRTPPGKTEEKMEVEIKTNGGGRFAFKKPMSDQEKRGFMSKLSQTAKQQEGGGGAQHPPTSQQRPADASGTNFPHGANAPPQENYKL